MLRRFVPLRYPAAPAAFGGKENSVHNLRSVTLPLALLVAHWAAASLLLPSAALSSVLRIPSSVSLK